MRWLVLSSGGTYGEERDTMPDWSGGQGAMKTRTGCFGKRTRRLMLMIWPKYLQIWKKDWRKQRRNVFIHQRNRKTSAIKKTEGIARTGSGNPEDGEMRPDPGLGAYPARFGSPWVMPNFSPEQRFRLIILKYFRYENHFKNKILQKLRVILFLALFIENTRNALKVTNLVTF